MRTFFDMASSLGWLRCLVRTRVSEKFLYRYHRADLKMRDDLVHNDSADGSLPGKFLPDTCSPTHTLPACAGRYDDEGVIYLRQRVVNVMQSGGRVVSHKRE